MKDRASAASMQRGVSILQTATDDIFESDSPAAMSSFLATRGEARGLSTKAQVGLQEKIKQASKRHHDNWNKLEKEWRSLEKERRDAAYSFGITGGGGPIVELNVGGTDMDVLRTDLVRGEDSVLALVFGGRWEGRLPRDSRGRVFVDVSPAVFRKVVGFLVKLGNAKPGKAIEQPTLTAEEQASFDHLVLVLGLWPHVYEGRTSGPPPPKERVKPKDIPVPAIPDADARRFGQSVANAFAVEEVALEMADVEFRTARQKYDREIASVAEFAGAPAGFGREGIDDDIVELNIGGTVMATRRSTLCRCPDSVLARMFDHSNEKRTPPFVRDTKGRYFVQYNDYCFAKIIEVLRMKRWPWPPTKSSFGAVLAEGTDISRFRIFVREDEREDFGSLATYFFPGNENFVIEAVGKEGDEHMLRKRLVRRPSVMPPAPAPAAASAGSSAASSGSSASAASAPSVFKSSRSPSGKSPSGRSPSGSSSGKGGGSSQQSSSSKQRSSRSSSSSSSSSSRIDPAKLPSEISVLEIRVGLVRKVTALQRNKRQAMIAVKVNPNDEDHSEERTVLWHFDAPPPRRGSPVIVLCNLPSIKHEGILFTAVVLCMDDDLMVPPRDAPVGELVTVKGHPPTPSRNTAAVYMIWDKVLNEELLQVGDDEIVRYEHKKTPGPLMTSKGPVMCT